jgi:hypothetical protein
VRLDHDKPDVRRTTRPAWRPWTVLGPTLALAAVLSSVSCADTDVDTPQPTPPANESTDTAARGGPFPKTARPDLVAALEADVTAIRHPSDGGGRAWLESAPAGDTTAMASTPGRWTIVYAAGPLGIAEHGVLFFQVSPFWGWSTPQVDAPDRPGYTTVSTDADGVTLSPRTLGPQLLAIEVSGRGLRADERVHIIYGAGAGGAVADRYAERGSRFWVAVDGDGDGVRQLIAASPAITVRAGAPALLRATLPTTAHPGQTITLHIAVLDHAGNAGVPMAGDVTIADPPAGLDLPSTISLSPDGSGQAVVPVTARAAGVYRLRVLGPDGLETETNPLEVSASAPRVLWGDLHGHSNFSDGTGLPDAYFQYARDIAALDVVALTDHDHWGMEFLDSHPALWKEIVAQTREFHDPGRFVTLLGYEWTSWLYGHRHVLYFTDDGAVHSSLDADTETPAQLWTALAGQAAMTFAHHSAGGPIATDWSYAPDPVLEPLTEVVSVHGSSEAEDSPARIYSPVPGNFVRDVLDRGYRFGFVGSGDSHDGHPGLAHLAARTGGLAAILSEDLTRASVLEALRARRVYATSGPRILLRFSLSGARMGSAVSMDTLPSQPEILVRAVGTAPLERIDIIQSGQAVESVACDGVLDFTMSHPITDLGPGGYVYVRVVQADGGLAWSSPIYVE